jgi:hypothetical protein
MILAKQEDLSTATLEAVALWLFFHIFRVPQITLIPREEHKRMSREPILVVALVQVHAAAVAILHGDSCTGPCLSVACCLLHVVCCLLLVLLLLLMPAPVC